MTMMISSERHQDYKMRDFTLAPCLTKRQGTSHGCVCRYGRVWKRSQQHGDDWRQVEIIDSYLIHSTSSSVLQGTYATKIFRGGSNFSNVEHSVEIWWRTVTHSTSLHPSGASFVRLYIYRVLLTDVFSLILWLSEGFVAPQAFFYFSGPAVCLIQGRESHATTNSVSNHHKKTEVRLHFNKAHPVPVFCNNLAQDAQ